MIEPILTNQLLQVLNIVKGVKSEYVCIPRMFTMTPILSENITGISDNAICHVTDLNELIKANDLINKPLWSNINLTHIVLMTKDINPFIKLL